MENRFFGAEFENITMEWEAKQNDKGVIYYVNTNQTTSWNHPYFNKLLEELVIYRNIKYAVYRTSLKLRYLQSHIGLNWIKLAAVKEAFAESTELADTHLSYSDALSLIQNVLHISSEQQIEEDIRTAADLILNLMMNLYDVNRCGKIVSRSIRNALVTLCCCRLTEKYQYLFISVRGDDQNVSKEKLFYLLDDFIQIPYAIQEGESFGRNVAATVDSCFKAGGSLQGQVNSECFYRWLTQEPQTLVWLPTFHRVLATETVEHNVRCNVCGTVQITGLRYRCLQCVKYELCQGCFLQGQTSLSHKLKHPVREYCLPTSIKDSTKALLEILKNKLRRNHRRQTKTAYLPVKPFTEDGALANRPAGSIHNSIASVSGSVDSGLAIGTDHRDVVIEEREVKRCNKTSEILGEPCSSSSPFIRGPDQPRRDIEIQQQQQMEQKIEQLKRENRSLQTKLNLIYKYCDAELTNELSAIDKFGPGTSFDSWSKDLTKETTDMSVSPIANSSIASSNSLLKRHVSVENKQSPSVLQQSVDIRHIIGTFTPVRHTQPTSQTSQLSFNQNELSVEQQTPVGQNDSSVPDGLAYRSADMSLPFDSTQDEVSQGKQDFHVDGVGLNESVSSSGQGDTLNDMALGYSAKPDEGVSEREGCLPLQNKAEFTRASIDKMLENSSGNSSPYSSKFAVSNIVNTKLNLRNTNENRQPYLFYSSRDLKSKRTVISSGASQSKPAISSGASQFDLTCSESLSSNVINGCQNPIVEKSQTRDNDDMSVLLDEISEDNQARFHSRNPMPSPAIYALRQKMMGQVLMSTPISSSEHVTTKNFLRKQFRTLSLPWTSDVDKENTPETLVRHKSKHSQSISSIDMSRLSSASSHRTSVRQESKHSQSTSSIDMSHLLAASHRPETVTSVDSLLSSDSFNTDDVTENGSSTGDFSNLFRKAECIWKLINENTSGTPMTNGDVLENRMMDFKKECTTDESLRGGVFASPRTVNDGSTLAAAHNIGIAMAKFVHTTEQCQQEKS